MSGTGAAGRRYHDAGEGRLDLLAFEQCLQGFVLHRGIGQLHFGDLPVFALALVQGLLQLTARRHQVQLLLLGLLFEVIQFVARDDAALEQVFALGEFALGVARGHFSGA